MDNDDLRELGALLEAHSPTVARAEPRQQPNASCPLNGCPTEQTSAVDTHYVTSFGYETGERGREENCAERIARILAVGPSTKAGAA
ncbi:hypothetical protein [Streptomyces sp. NPDC006012]|uniref:hypothetical protein n=1 Tax=Streptomyces sp. NPDC006012 TaxID=3364739 RepID=UPI003674E215